MDTNGRKQRALVSGLWWDVPGRGKVPLNPPNHRPGGLSPEWRGTLPHHSRITRDGVTTTPLDRPLPVKVSIRVA